MNKRLSILLLIAVLLATLAETAHAQCDILDKHLSFDIKRASLFDALNEISDKTGYFFIYDSNIISNDKKVKLEVRNERLSSILDKLLCDPTLEYTVISRHIVIARKGTKEQKPAQTASADSTNTLKSILIQGTIHDKDTKQTLPYVSVAIEGTSAGSITNKEGAFALRIKATPEILKRNLIISHIGYLTYKLPINISVNHPVPIYLTPQIISLQEVVIRRIDPHELIVNALKHRKNNYIGYPAYYTTFYREKIQKDGRYLSYSEAIFKIYKPQFSQPGNRDQVKELKARKISNIDATDTLVLKIKGGISTSLTLDVVKNLPDFLDEEFMDQYNYSLTDILPYNGHRAYAISFIQRNNIDLPLYKGILYIDIDNFAILGADFDINQRYLNKAANYLILQKSKTHNIKPECFSYSVTYREIGRYYYMSHVKCDINIKAKKKRRLFSSDFTASLEMATIDIDTVNVVKFERDEVLKPQSIFSDLTYTFDPKFWGDYNYILPEESLQDALSRINKKISKTE